MEQITIGQDGPIMSTLESALESDGATVITTYLGTALPWTKLPILNNLTSMIISKFVTFIITFLDREIFAAYVALQTGKQVSDYIAAVSTGNQSAIDNAGDNLIHVGDENI